MPTANTWVRTSATADTSRVSQSSVRSTAGSGTPTAITSASRMNRGPTAAAGCAHTRSQRSTSRCTSGTTSTAASPTSRSPTSSPDSATVPPPPTTTRNSGCTGPVSVCTRSTCWRTASISRISNTCTRHRSCRCSPGTTSPGQSPTWTSPSPSKVMTVRPLTTSRAGSKRSTPASGWLSPRAGGWWTTAPSRLSPRSTSTPATSDSWSISAVSPEMTPRKSSPGQRHSGRW